MPNRSRCLALPGLLLLGSSLFAQTVPAAAPVIPATALASIASTVDMSDFPARVVFFGAGVHNGQPSGFTNVLIHAAGPAYAALSEDVQGGRTSTRAGIETVVFRHSGFFLSAKGNAGVATGSSGDTGGSYGVGGSIAYDLTKMKLPGLYAVFSGTWDYSNISDLAAAARDGEIKQVFSGGTYRFGLGKSF
jgi:hypothetical protein